MKRVLLVFALGACLSACGSKSSPSPTTPTPTPTSTTRIIGLSGNLAFGNVTIGQKATATLTITNTGNAALTVSGMTVPSGSGSAYASSFTSGTISAGGSQPVTIQFTPTAAIAYDGTLTVNGDQSSGTNTISISGVGTGLVPLTGIVTATGGARISGATVTVLDGSNAGRTTTTTNGDYRFDNLTVGNANLSANAIGYSQTINGVFINGANTRNFTLLPPAPPPPPSAPSVEYRITGTARRCSATYENSSGGINQSVVNIPFSYSWNGARSGDFLYMSCQINTGGDSGSITVQLIRNGTTVQTATANGFPNIATVSGSY